MNHPSIQRKMPSFLRRFVLDFEARTEQAVAAFAAELAPAAQVLDAGAGECQYAHHFGQQRYTAIDLAVGDVLWDYSRLHAMADLAALPFRDGSFDACLNVVTLEHVPEPGRVIQELARVLRPGGRLLLVVPQEWEVHQEPHDYFRYTRYGVRYLLDRAGFTQIRVFPVGGFFRLLSRRLLNGLRFFHGIWLLPAALLLVPPALLLPVLDRLDHDRNSTLGYICTARRQS